ncbi:uncharacterized protein BO95DRAFT_447586 [Aspergillus brunneoviolaceus CBS 621.78]|uniref:Uncharacterized protein n=1 Tax=Aspergillus brunneoviolaceus CBS 621.78 TaxID=1450534 RepID=A0ACD1FUZ3_9EURO|nr:hypothetical protein BO95DRAFT_447586 [Aspergillus brunneoviolaceus CBS 621.78]RAH40773.1 hypothetical protein BO95DRAFT_447586 [Aspergillus brunneoviolaceus CBS 621.78]
MPTPLPSSFASAAAGNIHDSSNRRGDGAPGGEWYACPRSLPNTLSRVRLLVCQQPHPNPAGGLLVLWWNQKN